MAVPFGYLVGAVIACRAQSLLALASEQPLAANTLEHALDCRDDTCFYKDQSLRKDDQTTVTLLAQTELPSITVTTGKLDRPKDIMPDDGEIEVSADGTTYEHLREGGGRAAGQSATRPTYARRLR